MTKRSIPALLIGGLIVSLASPALALDGWGDRRGMFFGLTLGGGAVTPTFDNGATSIEGDTEIGFNFRARVGGGASRRLTLDAEFGVNSHTESKELNGFSAESSWNLYTTYIGANYFPIAKSGFYVRGMGGLAVATNDFEDSSGRSRSNSETGLGFGFGVGYEFFANANLAAGVGGDYQIMSVNDYRFSMASVGVTATWY